jgi:hypothetical protein
VAYAVADVVDAVGDMADNMYSFSSSNAGVNEWWMTWHDIVAGCRGSIC